MRPSPVPAPSRPVRAAALLLTLCVLALSSGCVYRMAIQQGNFLDEDQLTQLDEGMTRTQVQFLLGTPMVPPAFNNDRWDYYYFLKGRPLKSPVTRRLIVWFEDEKVSRIDRTEMPTTPAPVASNPG